MTDWLQPLVLETELALLRPLQVEDGPALVSAASDGRLWELWYTQVPDAHSVASYVADALQEQRSVVPCLSRSSSAPVVR